MPFNDVVLQLGRVAEGTNGLEGTGNLSSAREAVFARCSWSQSAACPKGCPPCLAAEDYIEHDDQGAFNLGALGIATHKLLCVAAYLQQLCVVQLLLLLHPAAAVKPDAWRWLPVHSAAVGGSVPVLRLLLAVAPETAPGRLKTKTRHCTKPCGAATTRQPCT